ncbi:MAG: TonB-dependent receptor [Bacteroidota bacterium]
MRPLTSITHTLRSIVLVFCLVSTVSYANIIKGTVTDKKSSPIPGVTVQLQGTSLGAITDGSGNYVIYNVPSGNYTLLVSSMGFKKIVKNISVKDNQTRKLDFSLEESSEELDEVVITAKSESRIISENPIQTVSLDARAVRVAPVDAQMLLRNSSGVQVRQSGGVGSESAISLNGLTGNAVRIYYDGIPINNLGGVININNVPINLIDRIDVYKGVMPISVGTDALGGGINIVTRDINDDFLEASYEFGSFNTHRASFVGRKVLGNDLVLGVNQFFTHSDNDYLMRDIENDTYSEVPNEFGGTRFEINRETIDARRFNNQHISSISEISLGISNRPWADQLKIKGLIGYRRDELLHGVSIQAGTNPAGEANQDGRTLMGIVNYNKKFDNKLDVGYYGMIARNKIQVDDSTLNLYNWRQEIAPIERTEGTGFGEILGRPTDRTTNETMSVQRALIKYEISGNHSLSASTFYSYNRITGTDPFGLRLNINGEVVEPAAEPSNFHTLISGLGWTGNWINDKLESIFFVKSYNFRARAIDLAVSPGATRLIFSEIDGNKPGFGLALKYKITDNIFIRSSFERTVRIPTVAEVFGDFILIRSNFALKPEESYNYNAGFNIGKITSDLDISFDVNGFYRDQNDLIRLEVQGSGNSAVYVNEAKVLAKGIESTLKIGLFNKFYMTHNLTYQSITLKEVDNESDEKFIGEQIPNLPTLLYNVQFSFKARRFLGLKDKVSFNANYYHINEFAITDVLDKSTANPFNIVPAQHQVDVGSTVKISRNWTVSGAVNNILDRKLFDNFRVPKPGINGAIKISYKIN